jgi:hypothetical protein
LISPLSWMISILRTPIIEHVHIIQNIFQYFFISLTKLSDFSVIEDMQTKGLQVFFDHHK